jgi:hypothetical protein
MRSSEPMRPRLTRVACAAGMACSVALAAATAATKPVAEPHSTADRSGFVLNPTDASQFGGIVSAAAGAGDVNGDGLADLIIGSRNENVGATIQAGRSFVVFGRTDQAAIELSNVALGVGGFVINGEKEGGLSGSSVAGVADVNGDGLDDVIVGAPDVPGSPGKDRGLSVVVFGKSDTAAVELSALGASGAGFIIRGACDGGYTGSSVAGAGDVNGDGLNDLIVGSAAYYYGSRSEGRSFVVFGKTGTSPIALSAIQAGDGGFVVEHVGDRLAGSEVNVSGAGDVNGDGLADLIIGEREAYVGDIFRAGRSYVVFGKTDTAPVRARGLSQGDGQGFVIKGACTRSYSGFSVAGAGDVNGDGLADLIVGVPFGVGADQPGSAYVVFGKTGTANINIAQIAAGRGGFVINGASAGDFTGRSVASAGDVNGDGLADLLVGALATQPATGNSIGRTWVVLGKTGTDPVDLSSVAAGTGGFAVDGLSDEGGGLKVAGAGDINGDGLADLVSTAGPAVAGRSYVVFGSTTGVFSQTEVDQLGSSADDVLKGSAAAETLVGGAGSDVLRGKGGADVLYGGTGDDTFVVNADTVRALRADRGQGGNTRQLARIDGGTGVDTLALSGADITLDLTAIANTGSSTPGSASRIEAIERINLTGSGNHTLQLAVNDVQDIAGMNLINSGTQAALGWRNGSYVFPGVVRRHQLVVDGDAGDVIGTRAGTWKNAGTAFNNGRSYTVYNSLTGRSQLLVNDEITRIGLPGGH